MKRIFLLSFLLFFLLVSFLIYYFVIKKVLVKEYPTSPPQPSITTTYVEGDLPLQMDELDIDLPESFPLIYVNYKNITIDEAKQIASNLGFTEEPNILKGLAGSDYVWTTPDESLWVAPRRSNITYSKSMFPKSVVNKQLSDSSLEVIAFDFFKDKFNIEKDSISVSSINYLSVSGGMEAKITETEKDKASLTQINFTYKDAENPIFTKDPLRQIIYIQILPDGSIYKANVYYLTKIDKSEEQYALKNLDEIKNSLSEAKLISLDNDYIRIGSLTAQDIIDIDIEKVEVGYYFDDETKENILSPIYLLEGSAKVKDSTANYARLYLPATK